MGLKLDQNINYLLMISCFLIISCTTNTNEKEKLMKNDCLSIQSEEVFWQKYANKKTEFPLSLYIPASIKEEIELFDTKIKKIECLSKSMLFIHLNIDNGVKKFHYYTWDNDMKVYHIYLNNKDNSINTEIIKKDMKIFEEIMSTSEYKDMFIDIENKFLLDGSQIYLIIKKNQKIKRFATYNRRLNREIVVSDFAKNIKSLLKKP